MSYCCVKGVADMVIRTAVGALLMVCMLAAFLPAGSAAPANQPAADPNDKIIAEYTAIIAKNPKDAAAYYYRGCAYLAKNEFLLAVGDLTKAVELNPKDAAAFFSRGYAFYRLGEGWKDSEDRTRDFDRAIKDYSQAIKLDPAYGLVYAYRAFIYLKRDMYDEALADCNKALELGVKTPQTFFDKALAQEKKGQYQEAVATLRRLIESTTDQAVIARAKSIIKSLEDASKKLEDASKKKEVKSSAPGR